MKNVAGIQVQRMGRGKMCTSWFMLTQLVYACPVHECRACLQCCCGRDLCSEDRAVPLASGQ